MTGGEFGVTVTVRDLDVDPQLSEHVTVSVNDDVPPNVGLPTRSTVYANNRNNDVLHKYSEKSNNII